MEEKFIYIIGSLRNPRVPHVANQLRAEGFSAFDDWFSAGEFADDAWQAYEKLRGRSYTEALMGKHAENAFEFDRRHLEACTGAVLVAPAGHSAFMELGWVLGSKKPGFILHETDPNRYELIPRFATSIVSSVEALVAELRKRGL